MQIASRQAAFKADVCMECPNDVFSILNEAASLPHTFIIIYRVI